MYENLTVFLSRLEAGEPVAEHDSPVEVGADGTICVVGYHYSDWARELMRTVEGYGVDYFEVLEDRGCRPAGSVSELPVDGDPELALALLTWAVRGERFSDGCFLDAVESGMVERCLRALGESAGID